MARPTGTGRGGGMNVMRGLIRLWIVSAAPWVVVVEGIAIHEVAYEYRPGSRTLVGAGQVAQR
jgi:hypothetical protein